MRRGQSVLGITEPQPNVWPQEAAAPKFGRLASLDAFRGLTVALMILVNAAPPAIWPAFKHAEWNGWTLADTVFPSFLWISGVAITFSIGKRIARGLPRSTLLWHSLRRAVVLFCLGLTVYIAPDFNWSTQRVMGVLQRIAICSLVATVIYLFAGLKGQIAWTVSLLIVYWLLVTLVPVPHFGAGNLTVDGNLVHFFDRIVLGKHNYRFTRTWDPEGLLSTLPAIATTLFGVLAGHLLDSSLPAAKKSVHLAAVGGTLLFAGLICGHWLPINKQLWTSSFAVFMAGLDFLAFALLFWLVDGLRLPRLAKPFTIFGRNALVVYLLSEYLLELLDWISSHRRIVNSVSQPLFALLFALVFLGLMYGVAYSLYRVNVSNLTPSSERERAGSGALLGL